MPSISTQMHTIHIKNEYGQSDSRSYCLLAEPPRIAGVNDVTIRPPELKMPVFHKTQPVGLRSQTTVSFTMDYFGFIGELKNSTKGPRVNLITSEPIDLGDSKNNGSTLQASFNKNKASQLTKNSLVFSDHGTFTIECLEPPTDGKSYVVGIAQYLDEDSSATNDTEDRGEEQLNPIPIAAVPYQQGRVYKIKPANRICVMTADEAKGQVLGGDKIVSAVDFPQNIYELLVVENTVGKFRNQRTRKEIQGSTIHNLLTSDHSLPPQYRPTQAAAPHHVGRGMQEVLDAGFQTKRQVEIHSRINCRLRLLVLTRSS